MGFALAIRRLYASIRTAFFSLLHPGITTPAGRAAIVVVEGAMKTLLIILPFAMGTAACAPLYGANPPQAGYPLHQYRGPYPSVAGIASAALPVGRWDNVMMQPQGAWLDVLTADGQRNAGSFVTASNDFVRLKVEAREVDIAADSIVRVDRLLGGPDGKQAIGHDAMNGAAVGAGAVAVLGLVGGHLPPSRLFAAGAITGAYENAQAGRYVRSSTIVYLAAARPPRPR
jgi:hypothetical protein